MLQPLPVCFAKEFGAAAASCMQHAQGIGAGEYSSIPNVVLGALYSGVQDGDI